VKSVQKRVPAELVTSKIAKLLLPLAPDRDAGTGGGRRGSHRRCHLPGGARGVPFQFKGLPWRNSELSEMLVQLFYEFVSENARNAVIELQE
jgi:hypothetical protein